MKAAIFLDNALEKRAGSQPRKNRLFRTGSVRGLLLLCSNGTMDYGSYMCSVHLNHIF